MWLLDRVSSGNLTDRQRARLDPAKAELQLGWLKEYRAELVVWTSLTEVCQTTCTVIRRLGYSPETAAELRAKLGTSPETVTQDLGTEMLTVVEEKCASGYKT